MANPSAGQDDASTDSGGDDALRSKIPPLFPAMNNGQPPRPSTTVAAAVEEPPTENGAAKSSTAVAAPDVTKISYRSSSDGYHYYLRVVDEAWFAQDDLGFWYYQSALEGFQACDVEEVQEGELAVEYDPAGHAIFPRNAIGHYVLPVDTKGAKKFPLDFVGRPLFPFDYALKRHVFPRSDDGQPLFPLNRKGKPVVPLDDDDKPIFPTGADGKLIFPMRDGKPVPAYTQNEKCVLPRDALGKVVVPFDDKGNALIQVEKDGVTPIDMDADYMKKQWDDYQKAQAAQYQQAVYAQQVAAHYNTPQRGYAGFVDTSRPPPGDDDPASTITAPKLTAEEEEKRRTAKLHLDASLAAMRNKAGGGASPTALVDEPKRVTHAPPPSLLSGKALSVADAVKKAAKPSIDGLRAMRREITAEIAEERHIAWERRRGDRRGSVSPDRSARRSNGERDRPVGDRDRPVGDQDRPVGDRDRPTGERGDRERGDRDRERPRDRSPAERRRSPRREFRNDSQVLIPARRGKSRERSDRSPKESRRGDRDADTRRRGSKSPSRRHRTSDAKSSRREKSPPREKSPIRPEVESTIGTADAVEEPYATTTVAMKNNRIVVEVNMEPSLSNEAPVDEKKPKKDKKKKHKKDKKHKEHVVHDVKKEPQSTVAPVTSTTVAPAVPTTVDVLGRHDTTVQVALSTLHTTRTVPILQWSLKADMADSFAHINRIFEEVDGPRKAAEAFRELELINREHDRLAAIETAKLDVVKQQEEQQRLEREKVLVSQASKWRAVNDSEKEEGEADSDDDEEPPLDELRQEAISSLHKARTSDDSPTDVKREPSSPSHSHHKKSKKKKSKKNRKRKHHDDDEGDAEKSDDDDATTAADSSTKSAADLAELMKKSGIAPETLLGLFQSMVSSTATTSSKEKTSETSAEPKEKRTKESKTKKHKHK